MKDDIAKRLAIALRELDAFPLFEEDLITILRKVLDGYKQLNCA